MLPPNLTNVLRKALRSVYSPKDSHMPIFSSLEIQRVNVFSEHLDREKSNLPSELVENNLNRARIEFVCQNDIFYDTE